MAERWTAHPLDQGRALLAEDGRVYVGVDLGADDASAVAILDARSGEGLRLLGLSPPLGRQIDALALGPAGLYVAARSGGGRPSRLHLLDIADPARIRPLSGMDLGHPAAALAVQGNRVFQLFNAGMAVDEDVYGQSVHSFDFNDLADPRRGPEIDPSLEGLGQVSAIAAAGDRLYLASSEAGLATYDIRDPRRLVRIGRLRDPEQAPASQPLSMTGLALRGQTLLASSVKLGALEPAGLWAFDLRDARGPDEMGSLLDLRLRPREPGAKPVALPVGELGGVGLAWDGEVVLSRHGARLQAFRLDSAGEFGLIAETRLAGGSERDPTGLARSLIAATAGTVLVPAGGELAVYRLRAR